MNANAGRQCCKPVLLFLTQRLLTVLLFHSTLPSFFPPLISPPFSHPSSLLLLLQTKTQAAGINCYWSGVHCCVVSCLLPRTGLLLFFFFYCCSCRSLYQIVLCALACLGVLALSIYAFFGPESVGTWTGTGSFIRPHSLFLLSLPLPSTFRVRAIWQTV